jgi:hypothetical protein
MGIKARSEREKSASRPASIVSMQKNGLRVRMYMLFQGNLAFGLLPQQNGQSGPETSPQKTRLADIRGVTQRSYCRQLSVKTSSVDICAMRMFDSRALRPTSQVLFSSVTTNTPNCQPSVGKERIANSGLQIADCRLADCMVA